MNRARRDDDVRTGLAPSKLEWPPGSAMSHTSPLAKSSLLTFIGSDGARNDYDYDRKALTQVLAILSVDHAAGAPV